MDVAQMVTDPLGAGHQLVGQVQHVLRATSNSPASPRARRGSTDS